MNLKYEKWAMLSLKHNYYRDSAMRDYDLVMLGNTPTIMEKNGIRMVKENDHHTLYVRQIENYSILEELAKQATKLHFGIKLQDPDFLSFTDLPLQKQHQTFEIIAEKRYFFFDQQTENSRLHQTTFVGGEDQRHFVTPKFKVKYLSEESVKVNVEIKDLSGKSIYEETIEKTAEQQTFTIDLTEKVTTEECYTISINEQESYPLFVTENPQAFQGFACVELLVQPKSDETAPYEIHFDNRAVQWRYNIVMMDGKKKPLELRKIEIVNSGMSLAEISNNVSALESEAVPHANSSITLPNGQEAIALLTNDAFRLKEEQSLAFLLRVIEQGSKDHYILLPYASKSAIKPLDNFSRKEEYLSDIYVYY